MSRRDTIESRIIAYFNEVAEDPGKVMWGIIQGIARKRGLTLTATKRGKGRKARVNGRTTVEGLATPHTVAVQHDDVPF